MSDKRDQVDAARAVPDATATERADGVVPGDPSEDAPTDPSYANMQGTGPDQSKYVIEPEYDVELASILGRPRQVATTVAPGSAPDEPNTAATWWGEQSSAPVPSTALDEITQVSRASFGDGEETVPEQDATADAPQAPPPALESVPGDEATVEETVPPEAAPVTAAPEPTTEEDQQPAAAVPAPAESEEGEESEETGVPPRPSVHTTESDEPPWSDPKVGEPIPAQSPRWPLWGGIAGGVAVVLLFIAVGGQQLGWFSGEPTPTQLASNVTDTLTVQPTPSDESTAEGTPTEEATGATSPEAAETGADSTPEATAEQTAATVAATPTPTPHASRTARTPRRTATPVATATATATRAARTPTPRRTPKRTPTAAETAATTATVAAATPTKVAAASPTQPPTAASASPTPKATEETADSTPSPQATSGKIRQIVSTATHLANTHRFDPAIAECQKLNTGSPSFKYCLATVYFSQYATDGDETAALNACNEFRSYVLNPKAHMFRGEARQGMKGLRELGYECVE